MVAVISAIDKQSVHKICSGQVVLDLATAVKELVENSIDAGATSVAINFKDNGLEGLEVVDDGCGIDPVNYETIALKHYTSKLSTFEDLERVVTFGFRGEALSSLCALCDLSIITATKDQAPMGCKLEFDKNGKLVSKAPAPRTMGTTIHLSSIFHSLPVRHQEFKRNIKREYNKALTILQAYAIICANIRISVSNQVGKRPSMKVISTSGNKEIIANISNVFGAKLTSQIMPFQVDLTDILGQGTVEGFISKPEWGIGRSSSDRQYFFVNGRPCILPKMAKTLNEVYRMYISNQYPVAIVNFKVPTDAYDVNVSPDKRTIFLHEENKIAESILEQLQKQMEPSRSTFQTNALLTTKVPPIDDTATTVVQTSTETNETQRNLLPSTSLSPINKSMTPPQPSHTLRTKSSPITISDYTQFSSKSLKRPISSPSRNILSNFVYKKPRLNTTPQSLLSLSKSMADKENPSVTVATLKTVETELPDATLDTQTGSLNSGKNLPIEPTETILRNDTLDAKQATNTKEYVEINSSGRSYSGLWKTLGRSRTVQLAHLDDLFEFHLQHISTGNNITQSDGQFDIESDTAKTLKGASVNNTNDNERATRALSRVITKSDFAKMEILGQFNLGFIITSLEDKDLYIVDQHASDEKYNFETLQQSTQIDGQRLISPPILDLTAAEEHIVMDNLDIFKANGFDVEVLPDNEPTKRIRVISQPVSKNTMFDKKDFSEIIHLINERPGEMVRCSRNRAMFASRACHKATRIGDSLNKRQMTTIIRHMGEIEQPWNCPHGRPTMRHLFNLSDYRQLKPKYQKRPLTFTGTLFSS